MTKGYEYKHGERKFGETSETMYVWDPLLADSNRADYP